METFETIKKFLADGGKCLLIENGKSVGVVLTMEEYELLRSKFQISNPKSQKEEQTKSEKLLIPRINNEQVVNPANPIGLPTKISEEISVGESMIKEMEFPDLPAEALAKAGVPADPADINLVDAGDVTLEDLGLDELLY